MYDKIVFEIVNVQRLKDYLTIRKDEVVKHRPQWIKATMYISRDIVVEGIEKESPLGKIIAGLNWVSFDDPTSTYDVSAGFTIIWLMDISLARFLFEKFTGDLRANLLYLDNYLHSQ